MIETQRRMWERARRYADYWMRRAALAEFVGNTPLFEKLLQHSQAWDRISKDAAKQTWELISKQVAREAIAQVTQLERDRNRLYYSAPEDDEVAKKLGLF